MKRKRLIYAGAFVILTGIEILIGMFVHDSFVRPYLGDVLVVMVLYCLVRIFVPDKIRMLPLYLFLFVAGVEVLQGLQIADKLGITSPVLRTMIGTVCDVKDILCYAVGCALLGLYEMIKWKKLVRECSADEGGGQQWKGL